jgi:biopolymer transport protein ExbB
MNSTRRRIFWALLLTLAFATFAQAQTQLHGPPMASERQDAATQAATPAAPANEQPLNKTSFLELLSKGGWAMWPLAACSLLGLALAIERGLALRRSQIMPGGFMAGLQKIYNGRRDAEAAIKYCKDHPSTISRIMAAGIRKVPNGPAATEQAVADQGATEVARLRRNLRLLHGIAAITPTLGLLGTVWGMIRAFEAASAVGLGSHSQQLTKGIYEALVATMTGLMIAVPVLLCYYIYLGIIDRSVLELNDTAQAFFEKAEKTDSVREPEPQPAAV